VDFFTVSGSGVGYFDGTNSSINTEASSDFTMGTGPCWAEFYTRLSSIPDTAFFMDTTVVNNKFGMWTNNTNELRCQIGDTSHAATFTPIANTWYHLAMGRNGNTMYCFVNGTLVNTFDITGEDLSATPGLRFGKQTTGTAYYLPGLLDNIRISKGVARYVSTFNPPEVRTFIPRAMLL
jgi:hypothetical protein